MSNSRYVILSVDENPQYQFYLPLVCWAWRKFGWTPFIMYRGKRNPTWDYVFATSGYPSGVFLDAINGYKNETIAQIARLYAGCCFTSNVYVMTSDIDMLPLSDYWDVDTTKITVWGHDLTGYQHMPICYIGMTSQRWIELMGLSSDDHDRFIKRDLDSLPNAKSEDSVKRWVVDQDLITERINGVQFDKLFVPRGIYNNGYPIGRVDRSAWHLMHDQFIDCHMLRDIWKSPDNLAKTLLLLYKIWPEEDFAWFQEYTEKFTLLNTHKMIDQEEKEFCERVSGISLGPIEAKWNTVECVKDVLEKGIKGDLVEAGVFGGCHPIIMSYLAKKYGHTDRRIHMIDSFQGHPKVLDTEHEHDQAVYGVRKPEDPITSSGISNCDLPGVKGYVVQFGGALELTDFHPGWFQDTLKDIAIGDIAVLKLDVDFVESLELCLKYLYPKLVKGGWFICDDYMSPTCKVVINNFMEEQGITETTVIGPESSIIYWRK